MTDFVINDHILNTECEVYAREIFDEYLDEAKRYGDEIDHYRDDMMDRAHETADGHMWVIYYHKAIMLCAHCNTDMGEEFLEDVGMPETPSFSGLATMIAYGEIQSRIASEIDCLIDLHDEID